MAKRLVGHGGVWFPLEGSLEKSNQKWTLNRQAQQTVQAHTKVLP